MGSSAPPFGVLLFRPVHRRHLLHLPVAGVAHPHIRKLHQFLRLSVTVDFKADSYRYTPASKVYQGVAGLALFSR